MSGFDKEIPSQITEYEVYNVLSKDALLKVANAAVDLPEGFTFDPDYLYLWVRIVSAGEYYGPNKNGDYFPEEELVAYYETFGNAHVFKNHENKKVEQAIGQILSVRWNPVMKCVEIFKSIDKKIAPEIARGFLKGYLTDVSMGCKVPFTVCSVCGNKARKRSEFCMHVERYRMKYLGNGERVFEINYQPNFHDSSTVLTGAERVAKAFMIINQPPEGQSSSFRKVASANAEVTRYIKLSAPEMEKVASHNQTLHPLLVPGKLEKVAGGGLLRKLAELEKEVSGKLLNVVSSPEGGEGSAARKMIAMIRFLTEKRMDQSAISAIGQTIRNLADSEKMSVSRVFSLFLGIAEVLGIELYPTELHGILSEASDAKLNSELDLSEGSGADLYPAELKSGVDSALEAADQLPQGDPSSLFHLYDEAAHQSNALRDDPTGFMNSMPKDDFDSVPPVRVVRIIRQTLVPMMSLRSSMPEFSLPRLATVISGFHPAIGGADARRDLDVLARPQTLGDTLAGMAYRSYQDARPMIVHTKMIHLAMTQDEGLTKIAAEGTHFWDPANWSKPKPDWHLGRWNHIALTGVPLIYGTSMFERNRRERGRNLSDTENFIADHPGVASAGALMWGPWLSKQVARGVGKGVEGAQYARNKIVGAFKPGAENVAEATAGAAGPKAGPYPFTDSLEKESTATEYEQMVKIADEYPAGSYNAFNNDVLAKFAAESGLSPKEVAALKTATLFSVSGMEKEAAEVLAHYDLPDHAKGLFLKTAAAVMDEEMTKAASDFMNNLLLDGTMMPYSFTTTMPGRLVDSLVMTKIMHKLKSNQQPQTPTLDDPHAPALQPKEGE